MAWLAFVKLNGVAPTAPGQWPSFLAFYAGRPPAAGLGSMLARSVACAVAGVCLQKQLQLMYAGQQQRQLAATAVASVLVAEL